MNVSRVINMKYLKELLSRVEHHPAHIILGLVTATIGIMLIIDDNYYFWPPDMAAFINSDCIGTWALFTGLGLIYVALQKAIPSQANLIWLLSQCAFVGGESFLEFAHGIVTHNHHLIAFSFAMFGYLLLTFGVIRSNSLINRRIEKRIKDRDRKIAEGR